MDYRMALPVVLTALAATARPAHYFVAETGDDADPGSLSQPFRTIQKAADAMDPGDTCLVRGGTYREAVEIKRSGRAIKPIRFMAYPGEIVLLDGTEAIRGPWSIHEGSIYKAKTDRRFEQLFVDRQMMIEARWPNTTFGKLFTRVGWATTGPKSAYQRLHDPELAATGIDWTDATAVLNVAHQFWTWSRPVQNHRKGADTFEYTIKMNEFHSKRTHWWADDFYYLMGKLEALDRPTEWFLSEDGDLYLWAPGGADPSNLEVQTKARDYGFVGKGLKYVEISGFHFFACTFALTESEHCAVEHCNLLFPSFARGVPDSERPRRVSAGTRISGSDNAIRSCSLAYCGNFGIRVQGQRNVVENCLIHDVNWSGTLRYTAVSLAGHKDFERPMNTARGNTIYNVGNTIINSGANRHGIIEYNHVHHGGLLSKDVSLIYTCLPYATGNEIRYNWVHDSLSPDNSLGIRGDDKTRGMRVHHNVLWNIRRDGVVAKGGKNLVYNNTCFANGAGDILFCSGREPDKWWQKWAKAYEHQNEDSLLINNCANAIISTRRKRDPGLPGDQSNNYTDGDARLVDPDRLDFRPRSDSPLVDAGRAVEGVTAPFAGKAPDIGAYEHGGDHWLPGHRNGVWLSCAEDGRLRAALCMPILEPVAVDVLTDGRALQTLEFTPANWAASQSLAEGGTSAALRFQTECWGAATIADASAITPLKGARAVFERPDLASAKAARPRFNYEEVYQTTRGLKPLARAFRTERSVKVDGVLEAKEWPGRSAERSLPLISLKTKADRAYPSAGSGYVLFDDKNLYVAVRIACQDTAALKRTGGEWGEDDGVELDFRAVVRKKPGPTFVLHGFPSGASESCSDAGASVDAAKRLGSAVEYAAHIGQREWTAEFCIPFAAIGVSLKDIELLRFNLGARRNAGEGGPWYAYQKTGSANYDVDEAALLLLHPAVPASATNIVANGSFEAEGLAPWALSSNSRQPIRKGTVTRVQEGRDGGWCIRLQSPDAQTMEKRVFKWTHPVTGKVTPGKYHLSYDVRLRGLTPRGKMGSFNSYVHVRRNGKSGGNIGQMDSMLECADADWTRCDFILTVPEGAEPSMLSLQLHRATGTVWIDNVSLSRCGEL